MDTLTILCSSDWHPTVENESISKPMIEQVCNIVERERPHLFVGCGDHTHRRGYLQPQVMRTLRNAFYRIDGVVNHQHIIAGNHDFHATGGVGNLSALLDYEFEGEQTNDMEHTSVHETPAISMLTNEVGALFLPCYSKHSYPGFGEGAADESDIAAALRAYIQTQRACLIECGAKWVLCFTHLAVDTVQLDNEQLMQTGMDIVMPKHAFDGFDLVVSGHMHRPQQIPLANGELVYIGALAPYTWGDRWHNSRIIQVDCFDDSPPKWSQIDMHVPMQRIQVEMTEAHIEHMAASIALRNLVRIVALAAAVDSDLEHAIRIRVIGKLPREICKTLPASIVDEIRLEVSSQLPGEMHITELKFIPDPIDHVIDGLVFDSKVGTSVPELLDEWCEVERLPVSTRKRLASLAQDIEALVEPLSVDDVYEHIPHDTQLKDYKQWRAEKIDWTLLESTVAIVGENHSGKTNFAEAEAFALYGVNLKGGTLDSVVRHGAQSCTVAHTFVSAGSMYHVERTVKIVLQGGKSVGRSSVTLGRQDDSGAWINLHGGSTRETQKAIDALVGPLSHYLNTRFGKQGSIEEIVMATPAQYLDILQGLMSFDLDVRAEFSKSREKIGAQQMIAMRTRHDAASGEIGKIEMQADDFLRDECEDVLSLDVQKINLEVAIDALEVSQAELARRRGALESEFAALTKERAELENDGPGISDERDKLRALTIAEGLHRQRHEEYETAKKMRAEFGSFPDEEGDLVSLDAREEDATAVLLEINTALARARELRSESQHKQLIALSTVERLKEACSIVAEVPCEGAANWERPAYGESRDMSQCQFLKNADPGKLAEAEKNLKAATEVLHMYEQMLTTVERDQVRAKHEVDAIDKEQRALHLANTRREKGLRIGVQLIAAKESMEKQALIVRAAHIELEELRALNEASKSEAQRRASRLASVIEKQKEAQSMMEQLNAHAANVSSRMAFHRSKIGKIDVLLHELSKIPALRLLLEDFSNGMKSAEEEIELCKIYQRGVSRTGVPMCFLRRVVPEIAARANAFLEGSGMSYRIEESDNGTLAQFFSDDNGDHPVSEASGFQRKALGMCVRVSLASVHANLSGSSVHQMFQDEGFGAFDAQNLGVAGTMIERFAERLGGRFVYITHMDALKSLARNTIEVVDLGDGPELIIS
jgi:DNA repair exonuclease SbcCD nuclease subunit